MNTVRNLALVDDDEVFIYLTQMIIEDSNLVEVIKIYRNGLEAITFLKENSDQPDLLPEIMLLDLTMPVMDGWQFLEEYVVLKPKIGKKITIYIITSSITQQDINRAKSISEVTDYIIKPVTKNNLIEMIKTL